LKREVVTPAGPGTLADMLKLRVMDTWSHEQDIRRAVGRPGNDTGATAEEAVAYFAQFLPIVVAKRAGAPDGSVVAFEVGNVWRGVIEVADGRARVLDAEPSSTTVRLRMPVTTFAALVGGRDDAPDDVVIEGDEQLGRRVVGALGFMP
jgi:uncharacterized protein (TIGR03083 family)